MAWMIVQQPNGLLARFSSVVDGFTHVNMTDEEAVEVCQEYMGRRDAIDKVTRGRCDGFVVYEIQGEDISPQTDGLNRWRECLDKIIFRHGENTALEMVRICATDHEDDDAS